jgi:hypothetical protein
MRQTSEANQPHPQHAQPAASAGQNFKMLVA